MENYWVAGVNNLNSFGKWKFVEFTDMFQISEKFDAYVKSLKVEKK